MIAPNLRRELDDARAALKLLHLKALERLGVPWDYVCDLREEDAVGVLHAVEGEDQTYYPHPDGALHLLLPVVEDGGLVDLVAFRSGDPGGWLLRCGLGIALGLEDGLGPHSWILPDEAAFLHKTPLNWLRAGRNGLCIVDWSAPDLRQLCAIPRIVCEDEEHAARLGPCIGAPGLPS